MSAVLTSENLGLFNSSVDVLGQSGLLGLASSGQGNTQTFVNAANGNLIIQRRDEILIGQGLDTSISRFYNSQALFDGDNGDNWRLSLSRSLSFTGVPNTAGSTVTRTAGDGSLTVFTYDAGSGQYVSQDGAGAHNIVRYDGATSEWTWNADGGSSREVYDAAGVLQSAFDRDGNETVFAYVGGRLTTITQRGLTPADDQVTRIIYESGTSNIARIEQDTGGVTLTRVSYSYDANNRLQTITIDLTPENSSDSASYVTTYTYHGASNRVATMTQSDGTSIAFEYELANGDYRLTSMTDAAGRVTTYTYDLSDVNGNYTEIQLPTGATTKVYFDADGYLTRIENPAVGGQRSVLQYAYDADNNLASVRDAEGNTTAYTYDARGNRVTAQDSAGNRTEWTYNAADQRTSETVYRGADPDGTGPAAASNPATQRWVYDGEGHLRFVIGATGAVTELGYDAAGNLRSERSYFGAEYNVAPLQPGDVLTEGQMVAWAGSQNLIATGLAEFSYDFRGQLASDTRWERTDAGGNGVAGTDSVSRFVYDQTGKLVKTISARGEATVEEDYVQTFGFDGLDRVVSTTGSEGQQVTSVYADTVTGTSVQVQNAEGLITTSSFDSVGQLVSLSQSNASSADYGRTEFTYTPLGQLASVLNSAGGRSYNFYDDAGRLVYAVDETGAVTRTEYDLNGQVLRQTGYALALDTSGWYSAGNVTVTTANIDGGVNSPVPSPTDRTVTYTYDAANRLISETDGTGETVFTYDAAGRVIRTESGALNDSVAVRVGRNFHDAAGRTLASLDAGGYLVVNNFDAAGRLASQTAYANVVAAGNRESDLATILAAQLADADDQTVYNYYDGRGLLVATVDAERYLTTFGYDKDGNQASVTRYATAVAAGDISGITPPAVASDPDDQVRTFDYDESGRLSRETDYQGLITTYQYDTANNLTRIENFATNGDGTVRRRFLSYDEVGRLTGELNAEQAQSLAANASDSQVAAAVAAEGVQRVYDAAGRLVEMIDQVGNRTLFYYDEQSQLRYSVNGRGEVRETRYNAFGDVDTAISYAGRISLASLAGGDITGTLTNRINAVASAQTDRQVSYQYNERGLLSQAVRNALTASNQVVSLTTQMSYDAWGQLVRTESPADLLGSRQIFAEYRYDERGLQTNSIQAAGSVHQQVVTEYDAFGRAERVTDPNGSVTNYVYDRLGRTVTVTDSLNRNSITAYDAFSRVLTLTDAMDRVTSFQYDDGLRQTTIMLPGNVQTVTRSNEFGESLEVIDGENNSTSFAYDLNGNLKSTTNTVNGVAHVSTQDYDAADRLILATDADGRAIRYEYEAAGRLLRQIVDPGPTRLALTTEYDYSGLGDRTRITDPSNRVVDVRFDLAGNAVEQTVTVGPGEVLTTRFEYDARGNQVSVIQADGTSGSQRTDYVYDDLNRLVEEVRDPLGLTLTKRYFYDANGNVTARQDEAGNASFFQYDSENRLRFSVDAMGYVTESAYDNLDRVVEKHRYENPISLPALPAYIDPSSASVNAPLAAQLPAQPGQIDGPIYAAGNLSVGGQATSVAFPAGLVNPVVIAGPATRNEVDMGVVRVSDVGGNQFSIQFQEYDYLDGAHAGETISYMVLEAGRHVLPDGTIWEVGTVDIGGSFSTVNFSQAFAGTPRVFLTSQTVNEVTPIGVRVQNVGAASMQVQVREDEATRGTGHLAETVGYLAIYSPTEAGDVQSFAYATQSVTATHNATSVDGNLSVFVEEEQSANSELNHTTESIDVLQFGGLTFAQMSTHNGGDSSTTRIYSATTPPTIGALAVGIPAKAGGTDAHAYIANPGQPGPTIDVTGLDASARSSVRYFYDAAGNVSYSADENRYVTGFSYDDNGQLVTSTRYDTVVSEAQLSDVTTLELAIAAAGSQTTQIVYDEIGRERLIIDSAGGITEYRYDRAGNLVRTLQFAAGTAITQPMNAASAARTEQFFYDNAGRQAFVLDDVGNLMAYLYTESGERSGSQTYAASTLEQASIVTALSAAVTASDVGALLLGAGIDATDSVRNTFTVYDAAGRAVYFVDGLGRITESDFDESGRLATMREYDATITTVTATTTVAELSGLLGGVVSRDTHFAYDALGRQRFTVDALNRVTEQQYDSRGNVVKSLRHSSTYTGAVSELALSSAYGPPSEATARVTELEYDALDRVTRSYDAFRELDPLGQVEIFEYDAFGNRTALTNKAGFRWEYEYDAAGNLVEERSPTETFYRSGADASQISTVTGQLVSRNAYDHLGNVISRTEGILLNGTTYDFSDASVTTYDYDELGRQTGINYPDLDGAVVATQTRYDDFGNAVANQDVRGNVSYKAYDDLGRERFHVDAEGYVTEYRYDALGNRTSLIRYADQQASLLGTINTAHTEASLSAQMLGATSNENRELRYVYDVSGQLIRTIEPEVSAFNPKTGVTTPVEPETTFTYNNFGEVVLEQRKLTGGGTPTWASTYRYYNDLGQQTTEVNALGYLTRTTFNAFGEAELVTEYDTALNVSSLNVLAEPTPVVNGAADRTRRFAYDSLGRVTNEYMQAATYYSANGTDLSAATTEEIRVLTTGYDAVGNVVSLTDVGGNRSETGFNALGHAVWSKNPTREILRDIAANGANGINTAQTLDQSLVAETPLTTYRYDVFGNVLSLTAHATGAAAGETSVSSSLDDRITYFAYNELRLKSEEVDAIGGRTSFEYDVAGHVISESRDYQGRDSSNPATTVTYTAETQYDYDRLGQQITTRVLLGDTNQLNYQAVGDQAIEVAYNAFGEVSARGTNRSAFEETFTYDNAGRVILGLNDKGVPVDYSYDLAGNLTRESSASNGDRLYFYDALGRGVRVDNEIIAQSFSDPTTNYVGSSTVLTYDRWGNVTEQANRSVQWGDLTLPPTRTEQTVFRFQYNRFDQVVLEQKPETNVVAEHGGEARQAVTTEYFYDIQGRQIAERDTRGGERFKLYNSAGQLLEEIDALGSSTRYAHNIFGEQVAKENALGYVTTTEYDRLGQAIQVGDIRLDDNQNAYNQQLIANTYNALGHKVETMFAHSLTPNGSGGFVTNNVTSFSDYDSRGNLVRTQSATGVVIKYAYDSQGRRTLQRYDGLWSGTAPNRDQLTWAYDYFGQLQTFNDLSGLRTFYFQYDARGLLTRRYQSGETDVNTTGINYTYYDNGAIESVDDNVLDVLARYEYDAQGRRTYEYVTGLEQRDAISIIFEQETTTTYDEHGRLARVITTDLRDNLVTMDATYGYDEAGNRRYVRVVSNYDPTFVEPTNNAPVANTTIPAQTVMETETRTLTLGSNIFTDPDGHAMTYSIRVATGELDFYWDPSFLEPIDYWNITGYEAPPPWMSLQVNGQTLSLQIDNPPLDAAQNNSNSSNGRPGEYRVYVTATDTFNTSVTTQFNLQVEDYVELNIAPAIGTAIPNQAATEGQAFAYTVPASAFTDSNGDALTYSVFVVTQELVQISGYPEPEFEMQEVESPLPSWLTFNPSTRTFSGTRTGITVDETLNIRVYATEQGTAEAYRASQNFTLTAQALNDAPVLSNPPLSTYIAAPNTAFNLDFLTNVFTDPNNDPLTYSASGYPAWVTFNPSAVQFTGTPASSDVGASTITLTATDPDGLSRSTTFTLRVNSTPVVTTPIANTSTQASRAFNLNVAGNFSDPDGQSLTFLASQEISEYDYDLNETFTYNAPLPTWLTFSPAGQFTGTPPTTAVGQSYVIDVRAFDGYTTGTDRFVLTVTAFQNVAPVVSTLLANQSVQETASRTYTFPSNAFTDADGHSLTYTARLSSGALLPSWISFNASSRTFTFNPAYGSAGIYDVRVTANDGNGGTVSDIFRVTVTNGPNRAPVVVVAIPNRTAREAVTTTYTVPSYTFSDPDGNALTYSASFSTGGTLPSWISFNPSTRLFTFSPSYGNAGTYDIRVTANDGNGATVSDVFRLTVTPGVNRQPVVGTAIPNRVANEGQAFSYTFPSTAFTDPDNNSFSYAAYVVTQEWVEISSYPEPEFILQEVESALPSWLTFNSSTRTFSGTRNGISLDEILEIRLYATEQGTAEAYQVSQDFRITVQAANDAPVLSNSPASTYIAAPNVLFNLDLPSNVFTDPNGDALTYTASGYPSWVTFTGSTVRFTGTPSSAHVGASTITLTATDPDGASRSTTFTLRVNSAPVVSTPIPNTSRQASRAINLNVAGNFSDPDGQALTFTATQVFTEYEPEIGETFTWNGPLPSWLSLSSSGQFSGTPPTSAVGQSYTIDVRASDGYVTRTDRFILTITAYQNVAPVVSTLLVNQSVQETGSRTYTFPSNAFTDADGNVLTYTARLSSGAVLPSWMNFSSANRRFTFNPAYGNAGTYDVRVTANDGNGGTVNDVFRVTVTAGPNRAPVVNSPIPNRTGGVGNSFSYTFASNAFTDPDGNSLTYTASRPSWLSFNAGTRTFTGTPPSTGTYSVTVTASDGQYSVSDTFTITVSAANTAPVLNFPIPNQLLEGPIDLYLNLSFYFSDPDGDSLTYSIVSGPSGIYLNPNTGLMTGSPPNNFSTVTVSASDGQYSVSDTFNIRVLGGGGGPRDPFLRTSSAAPESALRLPGDKGEIEAPLQTSEALPVQSSTNSFFQGGPSNPYEFIEDGFFYNGGYSIYNIPLITTNTKEYWYTYDAENRITLSEGVLVGDPGSGTIEIRARATVNNETIDEQGQLLSYDALGNQTMRVAYNGSVIEADRFVYNSRGELLETQRSRGAASTVDWLDETARASAYGDSTLWQSSSSYEYDVAGRTVRQVDYYRPGSFRTVEVRNLEPEPYNPTYPNAGDFVNIDISGSVKSATYTEYDADGRASSIENWDVGAGYWESLEFFDDFIPIGGGGDLLNPETYLPTLDTLRLTSQVIYGNGAYNAAGLLTNYTYQKVSRHEGDRDNLSSYNLNYNLYYLGYDSYKQSYIVGSGSNENQKNGSTWTSYDALGRALSTRESYPDIDQYQKRFFRYNADGQIINKITGEGTAPNGPWTFASDGSDERSYYFAGGELIGSVDGQGRILFEDQAAYRVVNRNSTTSSQTYSVRQGDTLRSIARVVFGSSSLWYLIADANGLSDDTAELIEGQQLRIPGFNSNVNDANAFKAFNAEEIIGDRTPAVPYVPPPPPSKDDGCGIIGTIIVAVVAIVVTVYTAGLAAGGAGGLGNIFATGATALGGGGTVAATGATIGFGSAAGAAFVGGVAGSVASQVVGNALGVVDGFSLRSAFASGLTSAFGAGIAKAASAASKAFEGVKAIGETSKAAIVAAGRGAATYLSSQAAQIIVGQDTSFSWRGLAASAAGSVLGQAVATPFGEPESFAAKFTRGLASGAAAAVASKALGVTGRVELQAIAVDSFANTLANSFIDKQVDLATTRYEEELAREAKLQFDRENMAKAIAATTADIAMERVSVANAEISEAQAETIRKQLEESTDDLWEEMALRDAKRISESGPPEPVRATAMIDDLLYVRIPEMKAQEEASRQYLQDRFNEGYARAFNERQALLDQRQEWNVPAPSGDGPGETFGESIANWAADRRAKQGEFEAGLNSASVISPYGPGAAYTIGYLNDVMIGGAEFLSAPIENTVSGLTAIATFMGDNSLASDPYINMYAPEIAQEAQLRMNARYDAFGEGVSNYVGEVGEAFSTGDYAGAGRLTGDLPAALVSGGTTVALRGTRVVGKLDAGDVGTAEWLRPDGHRLPATRGEWDGTPGNSNWYSDRDSVNSITGGQPIPFRDGYPDFSDWSQGQFDFDNLTGYDSDFSIVYEAVAQKYDLPNPTQARNLLRELDLTPHHHQNGRTIQLIPTALHGDIPHVGGASGLRAAGE